MWGAHFEMHLTHLPATKVVDGSVCDFVLGERTSKLHLPATKVVDRTVYAFVLGVRTSKLHWDTL